MSLEDSLYPLLHLYEALPSSVKSVVGGIYRAVPTSIRYGKAYQRFQKEAQEVESWDEKRVEEYQIAELKKTLLAANEAPFYRERFAAHGVDPGKFECLNQLQDYPLLSKHEVALHREAMGNPKYKDKQRLYVTTSGSSGVPVGFYLHKGISRPKEQAYLDAMWARVGYTSASRVAVIRGHTLKDDKLWYHERIRDWMIFSSSQLTVQNVNDYITELNRFQPEFLHMYPSSALMLAKHMRSQNLKFEFKPKALLCGSERLSLEDKEWLEEIYQTRVFRWYGHSERIVLAGEGRRKHGFHFYPTYGYVEFGQPDMDGLSEVICTSFHNAVMPFVRYRTGDYVRVSKPSDAEFLWPVVTEIVGRGYEFLIAEDGRRVSLTTLNMHDDCFEEIYSVQFFQKRLGHVEMHYIPSANFLQSALPGVKAKLLRKLGEGFSLQFVEVRDVEKTKRGKHRWLVTELKQGEQL